MREQINHLEMVAAVLSQEQHEAMLICPMNREQPVTFKTVIATEPVTIAGPRFFQAIVFPMCSYSGAPNCAHCIEKKMYEVSKRA